MVYKLVARADSSGVLQPVSKASTNKMSQGGRKSAARRIGPDGRAVEEVLITGPDQEVATWAPDGATDLRPLLVPLVVDGAVDSRWVGAYGVQNAVRHHQTARAELPRGARRLSAGDPAIPTVELELD
jgi:nicotinate phosphoribosyltransferase